MPNNIRDIDGIVQSSEAKRMKKTIEDLESKNKALEDELEKLKAAQGKSTAVSDAIAADVEDGVPSPAK